MFFDCIIIGGGAAGMTAAVTAARKGLKTAVIEHTDRIGKKILQTGNGKCNITNTQLDKDSYQSMDKDFVMNIINQFPPYDVIDFLNALVFIQNQRMGTFIRIQSRHPQYLMC